MSCSLPGSYIHGIFQARGLEWGAIAFLHSHMQCTFHLDQVGVEQACKSCHLLWKWMIPFTCLHSEAKPIWGCFLPRTRDCPIPVEKCLSCVIHCLKWDGAFNYSLTIFADVEFGGDSVGRWAAAASGFPAAFFFESKLLCNTISFAGYSFPSPINWEFHCF